MKTSTPPSPIMAALATLSCVAGCAGEPTRPPLVATRPVQSLPDPIEASERERALDGEDQASSIVIDQELVDLCELPTAHFDFDRSAVGREVSAALDLLVACLSNGPLKGRTLSIVGHADPRGGSVYNDALGQRRADSVAQYMRDHGLQQPMRTSSRGETQATGVDAVGWARDRKVVILLER